MLGLSESILEQPEPLLKLRPRNCLWAFASLGMKDSGPFFGPGPKSS